MNVLIKNVKMLRMVGSNEGVIEGSLGIVGSEIAYINDIPAHEVWDTIIDGKNALIMPGLINAHTHMAMSLLRNYADDLPLMTWLSDKIWPFEANLTAEDVYNGTMLSIAESIRCGCTTFNDMYFEMEEVAKAVKESGIRANLSRGMIGNDTQGHEKLENAIALFDTYNNTADGRIRIDIAPHAPYTCSDNYIKSAIKVAKEKNTNIHIHLSESLFEVENSISESGETPIQRMEAIGLFEVKTNAAHCVHLKDNDFEILKRHNVSVLYNPSSNLKLGNGFANVKKMIDMGINVALGTDGSSSNNNVNMFEELHLCGLVNKGITGDPTVLPAYQVLEIATINGAKALGIDSVVGSLEVGKKADIIMIDLNKAHLNPQFDLIAMLVYSASGSDVKTVVCNGKVIMEDYKIITFDEEKVITNANQSAKRLAEEVQRR